MWFFENELFLSSINMFNFRPSLREFKTHLVVLTAFSMTMLGLPFTCPAGIHMFSLFNQAAPSWNLILFALLEVIIVAWIYGVDTFIEHISEMKGGMCYAMKVIIFPPFRLDYRLGVSILSLIWKRTLIIWYRHCISILLYYILQHIIAEVWSIQQWIRTHLTIRVQGSNLRGGMDFQNRWGGPLNFEFYCIFMLQFQNFSQFWPPSGGVEGGD